MSNESAIFSGITATQKHIVIAMLQRNVDGQDDPAEVIPLWDKESRTSTTKSRIRIAVKDYNVLKAAGLMKHCDTGEVEKHLTPKGIRFALPFVTYSTIDVEELLRDILDRAVFHPHAALDEQTAIPFLYTPGTSKLVLVLGENAGGKSFFRRLVSIITNQGEKEQLGSPEALQGDFPVHEFIQLSMQARTAGGFTSAMVYGDEGWRSTGENSAHTVSMGISTVRERCHTSIVYWDEPDIGMSAGAAAGTGITIRQFIEENAPLVQAVFITSHSLELVHRLAEIDPHYIYLGDANGPATLDAWFKAQANPVPVSPEDLKKKSRARFLMIQKLFDSGKKD